ncbi:hypothetical protein J437_LFUL006064 [Ladona fulva]|uniref:Phorbol-ester/DAG-type domain-containing protein n=1 Tax=Ladona fulva TaxID=123851 RepID=A0A8K0K1A3_LADFU|nr:hypothetical protein J437_LFUL006064 [Ladona fulva]
MLEPIYLPPHGVSIPRTEVPMEAIIGVQVRGRDPAAISLCEYYVHVECQDFAVPDCKENATYLPGKEVSSVVHVHHWREGNLPSGAKCAICKKTCWSGECLAGMRCEWCGMTVSKLF